LSESSIFKRRSSVNFSPIDLSNEDIELIMKASIWAPSSRNRQPWRIIGIKRDSNRFNSIVASMSTGNQEWAINSSLIIIFCSNEDKDFSPKSFLDIGFAGQNAMLQATELGLETHPIGGWDEEKVKIVSKIPIDSKVAFILVVGKQGIVSSLSKELEEKNNKARERNPLSKNFNYDVWGKDF